MEVVVSLFRSQEVTVFAVLVGSFIVIKLLRLSSAIAVAAAGLPLALFLVDAPFISHLREEYPMASLCAAWLSTAVIGLLWRGIPPMRIGAAGGFGILRLAYLTGLASALVVVTLLFAAPELLAQHAPGWRSTLGGILLVVTLIGVSRAITQILKAGVVLTLWSAVAVVLGCQIFLHKMPQAVERSDLTKLERLLASSMTRGTLHSAFEALRSHGAFGKALEMLVSASPVGQLISATTHEGALLRQTAFEIDQTSVDAVGSRIPAKMPEMS